MLKILFYLKRPDTDSGNLEHITIDNPKKILEGKLAGLYACEIYLPETERKQHLIYAVSPIEAFCNASEFVKVHLQGLINRGYVISEVENSEVWKLEKKDPLVNFQEKIEAIRNDKSISQEGKDKILGILKETFGK